MHRYLIIPIIFLSLNCTQKKSCVIIAGSTSVQPFIEKLADQFTEKHPGLNISVQGGGSTAGIQATFNTTCNIGSSSRNLKPSEQGLVVFLISLDGIAIIVNRVNPVENLTTEEIRGIFSGTITNWLGVGGYDSKIIPVTREEGSGTRGAFEELIMHEETISDACLVQDSNGAVREIIATTPQGIGYISAGLLDERIKALSIAGVFPSYDNFAAGRYKLVRPFLLLTKEKPTGLVKEFIDYVLSPEAQRTLKQAGLIPVQAMKQ